LRQSTLPNLWTNHPPFQIDGTSAATQHREMLVQSSEREIPNLPALPPAWPAGAVSGLRARGAVTVDVRWAHGSGRVMPPLPRREKLVVRCTIFRRRTTLIEPVRAAPFPVTGSGKPGVLPCKGRSYLMRPAD